MLVVRIEWITASRCLELRLVPLKMLLLRLMKMEGITGGGGTGGWGLPELGVRRDFPKLRPESWNESDHWSSERSTSTRKSWCQGLGRNASRSPRGKLAMVWILRTLFSGINRSKASSGLLCCSPCLHTVAIQYTAIEGTDLCPLLLQVFMDSLGAQGRALTSVTWSGKPWMRGLTTKLFKNGRYDWLKRA